MLAFEFDLANNILHPEFVFLAYMAVSHIDFIRTVPPDIRQNRQYRSTLDPRIPSIGSLAIQS